MNTLRGKNGTFNHIARFETRTLSSCTPILPLLDPVFRIRIQLGLWIRIPIRNLDPGGQKRPTKKEKSENISCFEELDFHFGGLKAFPVA